VGIGDVWGAEVYELRVETVFVDVVADRGRKVGKPERSLSGCLAE
jgi:hypothetical protein